MRGALGYTPRARPFGVYTPRAGLDKLTAKPALIVWGDRDIAFRDKERERFEATFSSHRTVILEGAGHYIQEAAPDEIAEAIRDWWGNIDTCGQEGPSMTEPT